MCFVLILEYKRALAVIVSLKSLYIAHLLLISVEVDDVFFYYIREIYVFTDNCCASRTDTVMSPVLSVQDLEEGI
jgi:hypothetical protein